MSTRSTREEGMYCVESVPRQTERYIMPVGAECRDFLFGRSALCGNWPPFPFFSAHVPLASVKVQCPRLDVSSHVHRVKL